jgi:hypothetical protein
MPVLPTAVWSESFVASDHMLQSVSR